MRPLPKALPSCDIQTARKARTIARYRKRFDRIGTVIPRYKNVMDAHYAGARQPLRDIMNHCSFGNANADTVEVTVLVLKPFLRG